MEFSRGETVEWLVEDKSLLALRRLEAPATILKKTPAASSRSSKNSGTNASARLMEDVLASEGQELENEATAILRKKGLGCHNPNVRMAGLILNTRASAEPAFARLLAARAQAHRHHLAPSSLGAAEHGRMPTHQQGPLGRDHNPDAFTGWMAGAGVKGGSSYGRTNDFGRRVAENPATIHDFWATVLDIPGLDHQKLTWYHKGLNRRITDVHGHVIREVLA